MRAGGPCGATPAVPGGRTFPVEERVASIELLLPRWRVAVNTGRTSDQAFIEGLFAQHHGEIYGFLSRMVRDDDLAADLTQETFIKAFRALDTLESPGRARAWLFQIASRTALDELRRRRLIRFVPWSGESRGTAPSAEEIALRGRVSGEMARALARIPDRQRSALIMAELYELSGAELAQALGVTHMAARALLTRARESLRAALVAEQAATAGSRKPDAGRTDGPSVAHARSEERR